MALPTRVKAGVHINRADAADTTYEPLRARDPVAIVIFGASGDLSKRKLIPALYELQAAGYLPDRYAVVGFSRTPMSDDAYRDAMVTELRARTRGRRRRPADDQLVRALYYQRRQQRRPRHVSRS